MGETEDGKMSLFALLGQGSTEGGVAAVRALVNPFRPAPSFLGDH